MSSLSPLFAPDLGALHAQWAQAYAQGRWDLCRSFGLELAARAPNSVRAWCERLIPSLLLHEYEDFRIGLLQARLTIGFTKELAGLECVFECASVPHDAVHTITAPNAEVQASMAALWGVGFAPTLQPRFDPFAVRCFFLHEQQLACVWGSRNALGPCMAALSNSLAWQVPRFLSLSFDPSENTQCRIARALAAHWPARAPLRKLAPGKARLRLGFLSSRFRSTASMILMRDLLTHLDRGAFEVFAYAYTPDAEFAPARFELKGADTTRFLTPNTQAGAAQIAADEIDVMFILPDWEMTSVAEYLRPSGVALIVNFLSFCGSTGGLATHRIIDDGYSDCEEAKTNGESMIRFEGSYFCYSQSERSALTRAEAGLPENAFVFAAFHSAYKLSPELLDAWVRVLKAVPDSVIWFYVTHGLEPIMLEREFAARGISAGRLVFASQTKHAEHLARFALADLYLDAFDVSGGTSVLDCLCAGTPVVSHEGPRMVQRVGPNLLRLMGIHTGITHSAEEYVERVIALATSPTALSDYRAAIEQGAASFPPFNLEQHAARLGEAARRIYEAEAQGLPRSDIRIAQVLAPKAAK